MAGASTERLLKRALASSEGNGPGDQLVSVVLADDVPGDAWRSHLDAMGTLPSRCELILVGTQPPGGSLPEGDAEPGRPSFRFVSVPSGRWGEMVRAGLAAAGGEVICYSHPQRTSPETLTRILEDALAHPGIVVRVNRRTRDGRLRRLGSLLFNVECRLLFDLPVWDVNGTPKVFPRSFGSLLELKRDDDLIDLELSLVCQRENYPVIELPVKERPARERRISIAGALVLYVRLFRFRREWYAS